MSGHDRTIRTLFAAWLADDREAVVAEVRSIDVYFGAAREDGVFVSQPR